MHLKQNNSKKQFQKSFWKHTTYIRLWCYNYIQLVSGGNRCHQSYQVTSQTYQITYSRAEAKDATINPKQHFLFIRNISTAIDIIVNKDSSTTTGDTKNPTVKLRRQQCHGWQSLWAKVHVNSNTKKNRKKLVPMQRW